jgi:hypothetical protein
MFMYTCFLKIISEPEIYTFILRKIFVHFDPLDLDPPGVGGFVQGGLHTQPGVETCLQYCQKKNTIKRTTFDIGVLNFLFLKISVSHFPVPASLGQWCPVLKESRPNFLFLHLNAAFDNDLKSLISYYCLRKGKVA